MNLFSGLIRITSYNVCYTKLLRKDFDKYDVVKSQGLENTIKNPVPEAEADFRAAMRGVKKNLILMDVFVFNPNNKK